ncbi:MAG: hypothetical protein AAGG68_08090 [Bacteroidota bacterium]
MRLNKLFLGATIKGTVTDNMQCGFYISIDSIEQNLILVDCATSFEATIANIEVNKRYSVQAFVETFVDGVGTRVEVGEKIPFVRNTFLLVEDFKESDRTNDFVFVRAFIQGNDRSDISEQGFLYSSTTDLIHYENPEVQRQIASLDADGASSFSTNIGALSFNTNYKARAYAIVCDSAYYSEMINIPMTDGWTLVDSLGGAIPESFTNGIAVGLEEVAYFGLGCEGDCIESALFEKFYQFLPAPDYLSNTFTHLFGTGLKDGVAFAIDNTLYAGTGCNRFVDPDGKESFGKCFPDRRLRSLNSDAEQWEQVDEVPDPNIEEGIAFSIGGKGYFGFGRDGADNYLNTFYEFDPDSSERIKSISTPDSSFTGAVDAVGFALNGKGYVMTGRGQFDALQSAIWEFTPSSAGGSWTYFGEFPGAYLRSSAAAFVIRDKAYISTGDFANGTLYNDIWEFDPTAPPEKRFQQRTPLPSLPIRGAAGFSLNGKGYLVGGLINELSGTQVRRVMNSYIWEYTAAQ